MHLSLPGTGTEIDGLMIFKEGKVSGYKIFKVTK